MPKPRTLFIALSVLLTVALLATAAVAAGPKKSKTAVFDGETLTHGAIHFFNVADPGRAAWELTAEGNIGKLGKTDVTVSASWDWSAYSADHPCALVDIVPKGLDHDIVPLFPAPDYGSPWSTTATVTFTTKKGDMVTGAIVGGSVCELTVFGPGSSVNETIVSFVVTGGTGKYASATGNGIVTTLVDSSGAGDPFPLTEVILRLDK